MPPPVDAQDLAREFSVYRTDKRESLDWACDAQRLWGSGAEESGRATTPTGCRPQVLGPSMFEPYSPDSKAVGLLLKPVVVTGCLRVPPYPTWTQQTTNMARSGQATEGLLVASTALPTDTQAPCEHTASLMRSHLWEDPRTGPIHIAPPPPSPQGEHTLTENVHNSHDPPCYFGTNRPTYGWPSNATCYFGVVGPHVWATPSARGNNMKRTPGITNNHH